MSQSRAQGNSLCLIYLAGQRDHQSWRPNCTGELDGWLGFTESGTSFNLLAAADTRSGSSVQNCRWHHTGGLAHRISGPTTEEPIYLTATLSCLYICMYIEKSGLIPSKSDTDVSNVMLSSHAHSTESRALWASLNISTCARITGRTTMRTEWRT